MDKAVKRYYKQRQHGGRSALARGLDGVILRLVFAAACYLWFRHQLNNQVVAIGLAAVTTVLFLLALRIGRGLSFERFVKKEEERLRDHVLRERLLLLPEDVFLELCRHIVSERPEGQEALLWCSQRAAALDEDAILSAYHAAQARGKEKIIICSLSPCTAKATVLLKRLPLPANCLTPDQILREAKKIEGYTITQAEVEEYIQNEQSVRLMRRQRMQTVPFAADRTKKYLVCAAVLFAASFVTGYALYYRLLAGLCLSLAGTSFFLNRPIIEKTAEQS